MSSAAKAAHLSPAVLKCRSQRGQKLLLRRVQGQHLGCRGTIYLLVNEPNSGVLARLIGFISWTHLIAWTGCSLLETWEFLRGMTGTTPWLLLRLYFSVLFTIEGVLRVIAHENLSAATRDYMVYIDLLSVGPFWLRVALFPSSMQLGSYFLRHTRPTWLRALEAAGDFRLLKLSRNFAGATLLVNAISRSMREVHHPIPHDMRFERRPYVDPLSTPTSPPCRRTAGSLWLGVRLCAT